MLDFDQNPRYKKKIDDFNTGYCIANLVVVIVASNDFAVEAY